MEFIVVRENIFNLLVSCRIWASYLLDDFYHYLFDKWWSLDTCQQVLSSEMQTDSKDVKNAKKYQASHLRTFKKALKLLDVDHSLYSFVDIGCGKGRALLMASRWPFHQIIGVEFCQNLVHFCKINLAQYQNQSNKNINFHILHQEATSFKVPEGPCVYYFFNPFNEEVLNRTLQHIKYHSNPKYLKRHRFIYVNPVYNWVFESRGLTKQKNLFNPNQNKQIEVWSY